MNKIIFPKDTGQHYFSIHYQYILDLFRYCKCGIELKDIPEFHKTAFQCLINGKSVIFDFADDGNSINECDMPVFKFHYKDEHKELKNIYPFSPVSFYYKDWIDFNKLEKQIRYTCNNDIILNNQRPYAGALKRRKHVREILIYSYNPDNDNDLDFNITDQLTFWKKINNCLVSVCVPGQNNNMLDRGQLQQMFFGCCTISPELPEILPVKNFRTMYPSIVTQPFELDDMNAYIKCKGDYSDLIEKIEWCKKNRKECIEIGHRAKKLCQKYLIPESLVSWILECINE